MKLAAWVLLPALLHYAVFSPGASRSLPPRPPPPPAVVNVGAIFTFNSTIGRAAKVAINAAVQDVNSDPSMLGATRLVVRMQDSSCSGFLGIVKALQFVETDVVAIIGPQCSVIAHSILHVANELQIPMLSFSATDPTLSSREHSFFVRTTQSDLFQMQAVAELVDYYGWKQVIAIFTDDDYGRNGVSALGQKLDERRCRISFKAALRPGATRSDISDLLLKVAMMEARVIVLHSQDAGAAIFSAAHYLGMMGNGYVWIATDWLSSRLDTYGPLDSDAMDSIQGVLTLRQHSPDSQRKRELFSRWRSLVEEQGGYGGLNSYGLNAYDTVWMVARAIDAFLRNGGTVSFSGDPKLNDSDRGPLRFQSMTIFDGGGRLLEEILKVNFTGVAGPLRINADGDLLRPAYDVINVVGSGYRRIGFWSNFSGLSLEAPESLTWRKPNGSSSLSQQLSSVIWPGETTEKPRGWVFPNRGTELRIGVPDRVSFREFVTRSPGIGIIKGFCIDVFTAAVNLLPYAVPYKFVLVGDGLENPSYSELASKVASGVLDAAVGDIAIVTNRTRIVDFTLPYIESGLVILVPMKKFKSNAWAFLHPFTLGMWGVTAAFFVVVGAVIWILEHRINDEFRGPLKKQITTIIWFSFSTLFFAHRESTMSLLGRVVLLIWLFVVLIVQSSYTASLTSMLTVRQLSSPIKGIDSLLSDGGPIGFQIGSFAENYLVEQLGVARSRLKALGSPDEYARELDLGPEKGGVAAVVDERPYVELFLSTKCQFSIIGSEFTKGGWGFVFPQDSPLAMDMSTAILTLSENGDLQRIHDKWLARSACAGKRTDLDSDRLHLINFWGLFILCGFTCLLASPFSSPSACGTSSSNPGVTRPRLGVTPGRAAASLLSTGRNRVVSRSAASPWRGRRGTA
ncbi:unnamed protein product [Spirodela intermedia]|uniref:Glutamate receptor n=1 Tax=Spirodela intermedia TaxID=51605 RepID=A0A7I8JTM8_SPIIN|nr:unnamed protein product [Spirodela intermedia]CAA6673454.1 unnamed protein product [Spirodela intermedia]